MLQALGVWDAVEAGAQPILDMVITDSRLADPVRPAFLTFGGEVEPGEPFAHMVESGALAARADRGLPGRRPWTCTPPACGGFEVEEEAVAVTRRRRRPHAHLLVAADGARSRLREEAGIGWVGWSYPQSAIVATIAHERDHEGRAVEHFLPAGPFAILPLAPGGPLGHRSSIVWTERREGVPHLLELDPEDRRMRSSAARAALGRIALETQPQAHPLPSASRAASPPRAWRSSATPRTSSTRSPARGSTSGSRTRQRSPRASSTRCGSASIPAATRCSRPTSAPAASTPSMGLVTDGLNRLFSNDLLPVRLLRDLGLGLVDRMPALKRFHPRSRGACRRGPAADAEEAL